ncbi:uncharacterized protein BT62DRAFT_509494 [Guyanagaster necrorhizus]|uniref:DUF6697 domain-containing protein n=1 Tax=Guyanagaster necrorhizus TaxID=856835 RepID=A0A9P7W1N6_9AGAR|nr:uncharacterized protein BT62DRAFT_509494 [Guyanagaster necrorhizus MCA 3950]KAG7450390.1 hypothetical protein BT62DRAFT_509494 [Guyanagaster necrorhizus MCA 3950]
MAAASDSDWNARRNAFLNSVLEQLLEARLEIDTLGKRVISAEKERGECYCQRVNSSIRLPVLPVPEMPQSMAHEWQTDLALRLQTAETGFSKAKEEYNKLKESLTSTNEEVTFIKSRNQQLEYDLFQVRTQRDQLLEEQAHLSTVLRNDYAAQAFPDNATGSEIDRNGHWTLEKDSRGSIPELISIIQARDALIKDLQETVDREHSLNHQLKQNLATVSSEMRNASKTVLETISTRLHAPTSTRKRSESEPSSSRNPGAVKETILPADRQSSTCTLQPTRSVVHRKSVLAKSNDITSYVTDVPEERLKTLRDLETVTNPTSATGINASYSRDFLKTNIGGSIQPLIVRVTHTQTALAQKHGIDCYLCPNLEHNPWCPTIPGRHGYIFVGLGMDKDAFVKKEEFYTVFVGIKENSSSPRLLRYLGRYTATHVAPLTVAEWNTLALSVQAAYSETTKKETKDSRPTEKIKSLYAEGVLTVPCVLLKCVEVDHELSSSLELALRNSPSQKTGSVSPSKRRREIQDEGENVSRTRTRKTTTSLAVSSASQLLG